MLLDRQVIDLGRDTIHTVSSGFMRPEGKITQSKVVTKAGIDGLTLAWVDGMIIYADHLWSQRDSFLPVILHHYTVGGSCQSWEK